MLNVLNTNRWQSIPCAYSTIKSIKYVFPPRYTIIYGITDAACNYPALASIPIINNSRAASFPPRFGAIMAPYRNMAWYTNTVQPMPVDSETTTSAAKKYRLTRRLKYAGAVQRSMLTQRYTSKRGSMMYTYYNVYAARIVPPPAWYKRIQAVKDSMLPHINNFTSTAQHWKLADNIPSVYRAAIGASTAAVKAAYDKQYSDTLKNLYQAINKYATSGIWPDNSTAAADLIQSIVLRYTELAAAAKQPLNSWVQGGDNNYTVIRVYKKRNTGDYILLQGPRAVLSYGINIANKWINSQRAARITGRVTYTDSTGTHTKTVPLESIEKLTEGNNDAMQGNGTGLTEPRYSNPDTIQSRALFWADVGYLLRDIPDGQDICYLIASGYTQQEIANKYTYSQSKVAKILAKCRKILLDNGLAPSTLL